MIKRHTYILEKLKNKQHISVNELCEELNISAVTIRKDFTFLEQKGLLYRTHGGASMHNPYTKEVSVLEKEKISFYEKNMIGKTASGLIANQDTIIMASGTTVQFMAEHIAFDLDLVVITSSLKVALELTKREKINVIQLGGEVRNSSNSTAGYHAELFLKDISCDKLFLGVDGIDFSYGITTSNVAEVLLNKKMISCAKEVIVVSDSSKFMKRGFGKISDLDIINTLVTDEKISEVLVKQLEELGINVIIAK